MVGQYTHQDTCQRVDKQNKIANIGVVFIVLCIALPSLPRMFEGLIKDSVWIIIDFALVSVVSGLSAIYLLRDSNNWAVKVLRFGGLSTSVWFLTGALYHVYGLFVEYEVMSDLISNTLQQRLELMFGLAMFISILYERWMNKAKT